MAAFLLRLDFLLDEPEGVELSLGFAGPGCPCSGLSIAAGVLPFFRDFVRDGGFAAGGGAVSGIFCLFDRRPDGPGCEAGIGLLSLAALLRFREDDGTGGVGTSAAAGAAGAGPDGWAAWLAA